MALANILGVRVLLGTASAQQGVEARSAAAQTRPTGIVQEFSLTAGETQWQIAPGVVTTAWAYNGTVPGPELRVQEGDTVRVTFTNNLPAPTTIHWHGV
ncbi:MAG: multicopper oxidase domain-containing protein, partial [Deinococcus sp.]|nr:multicopper oxidase domain-containing protein [Deinococcus sp.]